MPSAQRIDSRLAVITAIVVAIIAYGSLYPFQFHRDYHGTGAFYAVTHRLSFASNRVDVISNVFLYIPFGLFAVRSLREIPGFARVVAITAAGLALSFGIEMAQYYDSGRDAGMADVYTNTAGTLIGAIAGVVFRRHIHMPVLGRMEWRPFVVLLLVCWLGYRLYPYTPALDPNKFLNALRSVTFAPRIEQMWSPLSLAEMYSQTVVWIAIALLLEAALGAARSRIAMVVLVPGLLLARAGITGLYLTPADAASGVIGAILWITALSRLKSRGAIGAVLFAVAVALQALAPFHFTSTPKKFSWIPFLGFLEAPRDTGIHVFFEKVFTYGGLLWILVRAGCSIGVATLISAVLVFCLRLAQVYLPGRSAEVTDLLMLLILAGVFKADASANKPEETIPR